MVRAHDRNAVQHGDDLAHREPGRDRLMDCYVTTAGRPSVALTGILRQEQAEEIAVSESARNPRDTYEVHGTNGHGGWLVATATDGTLTPAPRP